MNAVYILWLRQLKRYSRSRARVVSSLIQPLLFLFALGFGFGPIFQKARGENYLQFIAPGVIAMSVLFTGVFSGIEILWDRQFGFLKETLVAPVPRIQIVIGRTLGGATVACSQGVMVTLICLLVGVRFQHWYRVPMMLGYMFLIGLFFTSIGTAIGSVLEDFQGFQLLTNILVMPLFFLSNALFPIDGVSPVMAVVVRANPLSYGMDGLRGAMSGHFAFGASTDALVVATLTAASLTVGAYLFSKIQL